MKTEREIEQALYDQVALFNHHYRRKEYLDAELCAEWAMMVALFIGLDEKKKAELFGDRQPEIPIEGLIREEYRIKCMDNLIFKERYIQTYHTYQNIMKRLR